MRTLLCLFAVSLSFAHAAIVWVPPSKKRGTQGYVVNTVAPWRLATATDRRRNPAVGDFVGREANLTVVAYKVAPKRFSKTTTTTEVMIENKHVAARRGTSNGWKFLSYWKTSPGFSSLNIELRKGKAFVGYTAIYTRKMSYEEMNSLLKMALSTQFR